MNPYGINDLNTLMAAMDAAAGVPGIEQQIARAGQQMMADPAGGNKKPMTSEPRTKAALVMDAWNKMQKALPVLFDINEDGSLGDFKETAMLPEIFGGDPQAATRIKTAADRLIRLTSGATVTKQESEAEAERFVPSMFRSDKTNRARMADLEEYIRTMHGALTSGYEIPPELELESAYDKWKRENGK